LRIINSAYFGLPRRVSSVRETVRYLGTQSLKNIVLTVEVFEGMASGKTARALQLEALARACAMREVLGRTPMAEAAFATGVLSDVGQLLLATRLPVDSMGIMKEAQASRRPLVEVERERLGATHAEVGGALLSLWNLPTSIVEAVLMHHEAPEMTAAPNVSTALAFVCAIEDSQLLPSDDPHRRRLEDTATRLSESFPTVNLGAIKRQFAMRETDVA
jgi:HD-like signal output (HDOD) protein